MYVWLKEAYLHFRIICKSKPRKAFKLKSTEPSTHTMVGKIYNIKRFTFCCRKKSIKIEYNSKENI